MGITCAFLAASLAAFFACSAGFGWPMAPMVKVLAAGLEDTPFFTCEDARRNAELDARRKSHGHGKRQQISSRCVQITLHQLADRQDQN